MKVTIKEIAAEAGVSIATVSKALNGQPDVSQKTKKRIWEISKRMGYTPNLIARNLVKKGNNTIGVMISDITTPIHPEIFKGINETANELGYTLFLSDTRRNIENEIKYVKTMMQNRVAGLLVSPVGSNISHFQEIIDDNIPLVFFGGKINDKMDNYIGIHNFNGARMATEHLISQGHKHILMFSDSSNTKTRHDRINGYRTIMEENGLTPNIRIYNGSLRGRECGYALMKEVCDKKHPFPTAIFVLNDLMAIGAMEALVKFGYRVPEDISVMGYDDISYASLPMIDLSTVWQPKFEIGNLAVKTIHKILTGQVGREDQKKILQPELRIRNTTKSLT